MEKRGYFIRLIFSIILGFLPSFLFIVFFVQKGAPLSNYLDFLLNLNVSLLFWSLVIILSFFIFIILSILKPKEGHKRNKFIAIILILFILVAVFLVFAQSYLYTGFLLGSDILVRLSVDKDNLFFEDAPSEEITFKTSVAMNPFCKAQCQYEFFDISNGKNIEEGYFDLTSISTKYKKYVVNRNDSFQSQGLSRFKVSCKSQKTRLCYTNEDENERSILITLNYAPSTGENQLKESFKEKIISLDKAFYALNIRLEELNLNIISISNSISIEYFLKQTAGLPDAFLETNDSLKKIKGLWKVQDFSSLEEQMPSLKNKIENLDLKAEKLNLSLLSNISLYNTLINNLANSKNTLKRISQLNLTSDACSKLNNVIISFNDINKRFTEKSNLSEKEILVKNISLEVKEIDEYSASESNPVCLVNNAIIEKSWPKIKPVSLNKPIPEFSLAEPLKICCFYGKCEVCCDENCSQKNYPVIFLHGHSINRALAADYSLDSLIGIKKKLANKGYIDAGAMVISSLNEEKGLWGRVNAPIEVTASYYFDVYKTEDGETIVPSKTDSLDTYALRLKDIIRIVKYRTNKDKVIIIAHSMGGLVTRKYVEVFGSADIDKIILTNTPNHGIDDNVRRYCAVIGPGAACSDMDKDSIFINKLNNAPIRDFPIYNLIGIGCSMGAETGDGIVKNSSQYLDYATNYYVMGSCDESNLEFFHETMINPNKYPETYEIISSILKNETA